MFRVGCVCVCWQCLLLHLPGSSKEGKSWKDAQSICSSFEGSLVAIEDEIEQGGGKVNCTTIWWMANFIYNHQDCFVVVFLSSSVGNAALFFFLVCFLCFCCHAIFFAAYITMLLQGSSVGVWIGLRDEDTMKWTSGKPVTYTNWSPIEPKSYLTVSLCE